MPLDEQVDWFDQLTWDDLARPDQERNIRRFLQDVFELDTSDDIRLQALEWYSELALGNIIPLYAAMTFLRDATYPEVYIQVAKIKYLFLLFGDDANAVQEIDAALEQTNAEIAAEAYYRKGLIHLLYRTNQPDKNIFFEELNKANTCFNQANYIIENRVDALFFSLAIECLKELIGSNFKAFDNNFEQLTDILWQRSLYMQRPISDLLEWNIYRGLKNIKALAVHTSNEDNWFSYYNDFTLLAKYFNDIVAVDSLSKRLKTSYQQFADGIGAMIINQYYDVNLSARIKKINGVAVEIAQSDPKLSQFLTELSVRIQSQQQKKSIEPSLSLVARLISICPEATYDQIVYDLKLLLEKGQSEDVALSTLAVDYAMRTRGVRTVYRTGSPAGQQVLRDIEVELDKNLPQYPRKEREIFLSVLSDIISYAHRADTLPKKFFPHLWDPNQTDEEVFQNELYIGIINNNDRGVYYDYEPAAKIGGGRIDITYQEEGILFPIEIKKDSKAVEWDSVVNNYLAQVQTYTLPYSQLGILVIFDISEKKGQAPKLDFRDRFKVLSLRSISPHIAKHPDYIIAAIIYGNNISPSGYTTYSKK